MIAIIYHYFAHYRLPVLRKLASSGRPLRLVACPRDPMGSIKTVEAEPGLPFRFTWGWFGPAGIFVQPSAITTALDPRVHVLIYLGDAHFPCTWIGAAIGRLLGKRVLFWTHGYTRRDTGFKALFRRAFYRLPHQLLLYGHRGRELALETGIHPSRLHVIYNSLDYDLQARLRDAIPEASLPAVRAEFFPDSDAPVVLFMARLTQRKRFDLGLQALGQLLAEGHRVQLLVVGEGPERAHLERMAANLGIPSRFLGAVYEEETLARCFRISSVVVSPGEVGLTAMHAMAYGRPVITHNHMDAQGPEVEAIVDGSTGRLVPISDVPALAGAIREFTQKPFPSTSTEALCIERVRTTYNPTFQADRILEAVGE